MLLFIQLYAILFYLAIGNASLMLLINLLTYLHIVLYSCVRVLIGDVYLSLSSDHLKASPVSA